MNVQHIYRWMFTLVDHNDLISDWLIESYWILITNNKLFMFKFHPKVLNSIMYTVYIKYDYDDMIHIKYEKHK